ncbi:MAG: aromatic ring-opening dioxygenase subunit LigA [Acidimicrobiaceae bacterium]|nr:aromatic ring-opening dioxygenase subunit LigA [Acidimicrobiaceae bacterium]MYG99072.1 aromatic ring-opening dioxygenase subunit LigA [Acidimicrobiaceae bacterium]MYL04911.1 aromatic ring-opening dioxygenase subunit LigA [Acidimicrobiaceae bacterium]
MSLYNVQKFLYELNRDERVQQAYRTEPQQAIARYDLDEKERGALLEPDIGLLYHIGVNGQILMHFAAFCGIEWSDYLQRMRDGVERHGPVRAGVYALAGYEGVEAHSRRLGQDGGEEDPG